MKKLLSVILLLSLFACNNQGNDSKEKKTSGNKATGTSENTLKTTAGCGKLILFHKGAIIESTTYDANGNASSSQTTTVTDVKEEDGMLIARSSAFASGPLGKFNLNLEYKCDGNNLYMDVTAVLQNFAALKTLKPGIKPVQFPLNMHEGEVLPEASYTIMMNRGKVKMDITTTYKNRTVGAREKITTTAGTWDCFKVSSDIEANVEGADEKTKAIMESVKDKIKMNMIMWYDPEIGVVRTEIYLAGKLRNRSDITSIKE